MKVCHSGLVNHISGRFNVRFCLLKIQKVFSQKKTILTGNPIRQIII